MTETRRRIALLAAPETSASVLYGLYDVLLSVGAVYPDMTVGEPGDALLDVPIVSATKEPFRCFGNVLVEPHHSIDEVDSADVVISNGVLNLAPQKLPAFQEIFRVLRPGGRLQLADIVVGNELSEGIRKDIDLWTG